MGGWVKWRGVAGLGGLSSLFGELSILSPEFYCHCNTEMQALAHAIGDKIERAYWRGDAFEQRRDLMQKWADYLTQDCAAYSERWERFIT